MRSFATAASNCEEALSNRRFGTRSIFTLRSAGGVSGDARSRKRVGAQAQGPQQTAERRLSTVSEAPTPLFS